MSKSDAKVVDEAKKRYKRAQEYYSAAYTQMEDDTRFAEGDSHNGYQWPTQIWKARQGAERPCLTINKVRQHCLQIINDALQNKAQVRVSPTGDGATREAADVFEGIVRHIEYISHAQAVYSQAITGQVKGGLGFCRIVTEYLPDSFDQEIYIKGIRDPQTVYVDPDAQDADWSDAAWAIVFEDMPRDQAEREYPDHKDDMGHGALGNDDDWATKDHVRKAEYFRRTPKRDELLLLADGTTARKSELEEAGLYATLPDELIKARRDIQDHTIEWYLVLGDTVVEEREWPGSTIPIVPFIGEMVVIDGKVDIKGHTRALIDAQRMYNYWTSNAVEFGALQSKAPWITPVDAIEGVEEYWARANTDNFAFLPYKAFDDQGRPLPPPERVQPPTASPAYLDGMQTAANELMMASGQYQAQMGAEGQEKSGRAIQERQRQGDNATYHYIDHQAQAIRAIGRKLIDLIPKIYDTPRVIKIMAQDGSQTDVQLQPDLPQAHQQQVDPQTQKAQTIFNPSVGRYEVVADVGPAYATRREQAFDAIMQILQMAPQLSMVIGDLLMKAADFPMAEEIQERMLRMVPPQALGGPTPEMVQAQQALHKSTAVNADLLQRLAKLELDLRQRGDAHEVETYRAETDRMKAVGGIDPLAMKPVIRQMVSEVLQYPVVPIIAAHEKAEQAMQPPEPVQPAGQP